jgi:hypothetical protein
MTDSTSSDARVAALRSEIQQTRSDLGETIEALAAKADVKARARDKVDETKARASAAAVEAKDRAKVLAREKAQHLADAGSELVRELRTEPAVPARRAAHRMRSSLRSRPKQWAAVGAALLAFAGLVVRSRRARAAKRVNPQALRDEWRKQWKENR